MEAADVAFCSLPHGASAELAPPLLEAGRARDRPGRRLPAARIGVSGLVRVRASRGRLAGQSRLRTAGAVRRSAPRRAAGREPGLLPDPGDPRPRAAALGGIGRAGPDPRRREDRAVGRRPSRERSGVVSPRPRRACVRIGYPDISTPPRWSAASSWRRGSRPASMFVPHLVPAVARRGDDGVRPARGGRHHGRPSTACLVDAYAGSAVRPRAGAGRDGRLQTDARFERRGAPGVGRRDARAPPS